MSRNSGVLRMRDLGEHCFGKESIISLALNYNLRDEEGRWYPRRTDIKWISRSPISDLKSSLNSRYLYMNIVIRRIIRG